MKLGIHRNFKVGFFSERWIDYCEENKIPYKIVNCYSNDILKELSDCDGLLWHFSQGNHLDYQVATKLIASLESAGKLTFPNLNACWHFDDKVAQKYLLESLNAPLIESWVFYSKEEAFEWLKNTDFPKVFKLKGGASSANVKLVHNQSMGRYFIKKAFGPGFRQFDRLSLFCDSLNKYRTGKSCLIDVSRDFMKIFIKSKYEKVKGREIGYAYFQKFIPNNKFDIRIIVIGDKAFGLKRLVRDRDFRASGSGKIIFNKTEIRKECVQIAFEVCRKIDANCLTFDFLFDENGNPLIAEISYGFYQEAYDGCEGYWNRKMEWFDGPFVPQYWMVENLIKKIDALGKE